MNKVILFGNVGKDPEVKHLDGGNVVAKFSLATTKRWNKDGEKQSETSWHNIVLWSKLAELAEKYVKKGSSLIIEGEISYRSYENKEGHTVYTTDIIGRAMHFAGTKEKPDNNEGKWQGKQEVKAMSDVSELPGNIATDDENDQMADLPF